MAGSPLLVRLRNRAERLRQRRWRMAAYRSDQHHVVLGGAPRSGTTFLRKLLDRHPLVLAGPETKLFVPAGFNLEWLATSYEVPLDELHRMRDEAPSQAAFIDAFAGRVRTDAGAERWAEKTPQNIRHLDWILARFPLASVVHIIRDGRDVVCSMREHPDRRWVDGAWQKVLVRRPLSHYAERWRDDVGAGIAWRQDPRYTEIRYEDLAAEPAAVLQAVCDGVGLAVDGGWLAAAAAPPAAEAGAVNDRRPDYEGAVSGASVGRWRADLTAAEQQEVEAICGPQLRALGYEA